MSSHFRNYALVNQIQNANLLDIFFQVIVHAHCKRPTEVSSPSRSSPKHTCVERGFELTR